MTRRRKAIYLGSIGALFSLMLAWYLWSFRLNRINSTDNFDGTRAYADVKTQVAFGPRIPGTPAHARTLDWMREQLESAGWRVEIQQAQSMGHTIQNLAGVPIGRATGLDHRRALRFAHLCQPRSRPEQMDSARPRSKRWSFGCSDIAGDGTHTAS